MLTPFLLENDHWIFSYGKIYDEISQLWARILQSSTIKRNKNLFQLILTTPIDFAISHGKLSCCIMPIHCKAIIIIFPDLYCLLSSDDSKNRLIALAIIAHELGHIYSNYLGRNCEEMADQFAVDIGLKSELLYILKENSTNPSCKRRFEGILKMNTR